MVPNHVVSEDVPEQWVGRAIRCRRLKMVPVECVARGYLTGSGLRDYEATGVVSGITLPPGLVESSQLAEAIFTPSTKGAVGEHDEPMTFAEVVATVGEATAEQLRDITLAIYHRGAEIAAERGILIADTKIELGWDASSQLVLADEVLTPDCARFWPAEDYLPGKVQDSFDKQPLRDWAVGLGWNKTSPGPEIPEEIVEATRARYVAAYERLTGRTW